MAPERRLGEMAVVFLGGLVFVGVPSGLGDGQRAEQKQGRPQNQDSSDRFVHRASGSRELWRGRRHITR